MPATQGCAIAEAVSLTVSSQSNRLYPWPVHIGYVVLKSHLVKFSSKYFGFPVPIHQCSTLILFIYQTVLAIETAVQHHHPLIPAHHLSTRTNGCLLQRTQFSEKKCGITPSCPEPVKLIHAKPASFTHLYISLYATLTQIQDPYYY